MPTLPSVPQVLKFIAYGTLAGSPWANVLHWLFDGGPPSDSDVTHFCHTLWANYPNVVINNYFDSEMTMHGVLGTDLSSGSGSVGGYISPVSGTAPAGHLPSAQNAALVHHQVARHYKGGHPRNYLSGLGAAQLITATQWGSTAVNAVTSQWAALQAAMDADTSGGVSLVGQVSVSYYDKALVPTPPHLRVTPVVDLILGSTMEATVATQRRRVGR